MCPGFLQQWGLQTGPDGTLYVAWAVYDRALEDDLTETGIGFNATDDPSQWGLSWRAIDGIRGHRGTPLPHTSARHNSFPAMAVDHSSGPDRGAIYICWTNLGVPGGVGGDPDIYVIKSTNGGVSFNALGGPRRVNADATTNAQWMPWIACDAVTGAVIVVFYDRREDPTDTDARAYVAISHDGGAHWEEQPVSDVAFPTDPMSGDYMGDYIGVCAADGMAYPCWMDPRNAAANYNYLAWVSPVTTAPQSTTVAFTDKSVGRGLGFTGRPSSVTVLDYNGVDGRGDGMGDLLAVYPSGSGSGEAYQGLAVQEGLPRWELDEFAWAGGVVPYSGSPATGDWNNDGRIDIVAPYRAGPYLRLYENTGTAFQDVVAGSGLDVGLYTETAAWGDYNADGWVDLAVGSLLPQPGVLVFRNLGPGQIGRFEETTSSFPRTFTPHYPGPVAWLDWDADGRTDLLWTEGLQDGPEFGTNLFVNQGGTPPTFLEAAEQAELRGLRGAGSIAYGQLWPVGPTGVLPSLLVGGGGAFDPPAYRPAVWRNLGGLFEEVVVPGNPQGLAGFLDVDLDGVTEVQVYPGTVPSLGVLAVTSGPSTLRNVAAGLGWNGNDCTAGVAIDFDGDGDCDILQGRPGSTTGIFYESFSPQLCNPCDPGEDEPVNNWVGLRLRGIPWGQYSTRVSRAANTDMVGTRVRAFGASQAQWVQSTAGNRNAPGIPIVLGLGSEQAADLEIRYPNGLVAYHMGVPAGTIFDVTDESVPYVIDDSVTLTRVLGVGTVELVFEWDAAGIGVHDIVTIAVAPNQSGDCQAYARELRWDSADIDLEVEKIGAFYHHTFRWLTQPCFAPCNFSYTVRSSNEFSASWSTSHQASVKTCLIGG